MQMLDMSVICIHYLMHNYNADTPTKLSQPSTGSPNGVFQLTAAANAEIWHKVATIFYNSKIRIIF